MAVAGRDTTLSRSIITHQLDPCYPEETTSGPIAGAIQQVFGLIKWRIGVAGASLHLDGGSGHGEECGTFWLLPYWMGRYHGIISEEM